MTRAGEAPGPLRFVAPGLLLALGALYALAIHHGLGPRPEVAESSSLRWYAPRGTLTNALLGSSWGWLLERPQGLLALGTPALLLAVGVCATTRSALARAAALSTFFATLLFLYYALGSGVTQVAWNFFHWRASATMLAVAAAAGAAAASPWLAASWLRLGWPARLAWLLPPAAVVLAVERNVTGTDSGLPFAISPWPAVQVFAFETLGTTIAAQLGGIAVALLGLVGLRRGRSLAGLVGVLAGLALPAAAWLGLGTLGLLPFRVAPGRLLGAAGLCTLLVAIAALGVRLDAGRLRRRAVRCGVAALLVGAPLVAGAAWARLDYARTRDVRAQRIIEALQAYYERDSVYPDTLTELVEDGFLDAVPAPQIGFAIPGSDGDFTYQGFGTSYLLEFSAPRWVQCAYNPPFDDAYEDDLEEADDEEASGAEAEEELEESGGSWSCPAKPPELW